MKKRTQWFPMWISPTRVGVYERDYPWGLSYSYWDGSGWGVAGDSPQAALDFQRLKAYTYAMWRGLAAKPE